MPAREKTGWWDGYEGQQVVIIDEFYGWLGYDFILRLTDRYPLLVETKGGTVQFVSRVVIFTSNSHPRDWYPNIRDRAPFDRRFPAVFEFPAHAAAAELTTKAFIAA